MPPNREHRASQACSYCRKKKVKCDGAVPCGNCSDHEQQCRYLPLQRRGRKSQVGYVETSHDYTDPTDPPVESNDRGRYGVISPRLPSNSPSFVLPERRQAIIVSQPNVCGPHVDTRRSGDPSISTGMATTPKSTPGDLPEVACQDATQNSSGIFLTPQDSEVDQEEATMELQAVNWEHHGPGSWLSICSTPGLQWVSDRAGTTRFHQIAEGLVMGWTNKLTLGSNRNRERCLEPEVENAWTYVSAYFDNSQDSVFGVVVRSDFESRLRVYFQYPDRPDEDVAWYALRNAVYAVGCRAAASMDRTRDFAEIQSESLRFFHNAFSVLSELLFMPSGLIAIQALIVMTSFAELLGSPSVEYMLCSSTIRLAQSKGLHREPSRAWNLPRSEILHRRCVFWAAYCYDKNIALRSGRPSALDDDEISCEIPEKIPGGSTLNIAVMTAAIDHARICAKISKRLSSVQAFNESPTSLSETIGKLEEELRLWRNSLPNNLTLPKLNDHRLSNNCYQRKANILRLHYSYWGSIIALHAIFHYPWIGSVFTHQKPFFEDRISQSSAQSAEASRQILSTLRDFWLDTSLSSPIVFYFPMLAVINLFIYILKDPSLDTVQADLALLDLTAGHFARIHFLTSSQVSFTFAREIVLLANKAVRRATTSAPNNGESASAYTPDIFPFNISGEATSVFDPSPNFEELNIFSSEYFESLSTAGDLIIF